MNIIIIYETVEGQTDKVSRFLESLLTEQGHTVVRNDARNPSEIDIDEADAVILAAPVHEHRHPRAFEATVTALARRLRERPTLMLSVSLSAAFPEGMEDADAYLDEMKSRTGLVPDHEMLVAGAVRLDRYDYFALMVVKHVVLRERAYDPTAGNHEFTDWDALRGTVSRFVQSVPA